MTFEDLDFLEQPSSAQMVDQYLRDGIDAHRAALLSGSSMIASQVKYLGRAERKLPSFYAARCVIDAQGFEQCSSEKTAKAKFNTLLDSESDRKLAIDLTCGLGVDSLALSKLFDRVVAIERDPMRARLTAYNFKLLGIDNVEIINTSAESFLAENPDIKADFIYIDPSRQVEDRRRVFSLEDSSPDVMGLLDRLQTIAPRMIIKLSPMFDIDECFRLMGKVSVEVVSLDGECKEVLVGFGTHVAQSIVCTILKTNDLHGSQLAFRILHPTSISHNEPIDAKFLYVPDVTLIKTRTIDMYLALAYDQIEKNSDGYVLSEQRLKGFCGQEFEITAQYAYQPKKLRKVLREAGIRNATISHHDFPYSTARILSDLGLKEGGHERLFFSTYQGEATIFFAKKTST